MYSYKKGDVVIPNDLFQDLNQANWVLIIWLIYASDFKFSAKDLLVSVL